MITVGYSTRKENLEYKEHIFKQSGLKKGELDIIEVVNNNQKSLSEVYNSILRDSKHNLVILIHDDLILPQNFLKSLIKQFNETDYGIIGLAGTTHLNEMGVWWGDRTKMIGIVKHKSNGKTWESKYSYNWKKEIKDVVLIDGLFIGINKDKIKKGFNENYKGFHFYDIPFCVDNHLSGVKIGVTFDFVVTHKSIGQTNQSWEESRQQFIKEYGLPISLTPEIYLPNDKVLLKEFPEVSVVIPHKDKSYLIQNLLDSFDKFETYNFSKIKFFIADTGSSSENKLELNKIISEYSVRNDKPFQITLIEYDYYNFAKINNDVVNKYVTSELVLFCNNDVQLINNSLTRMVKQYLKNPKKIGTLGSRLYFENNTIQHAGMTLFVDSNKNLQISHKGLHSHHNFSPECESVIGNTGAFMLTRIDLFKKLDGFNEQYQSCFEDVEYNLSCILDGKHNLYCGDSVCYHFESLTRNDDENKMKKLQEDAKILFPFIFKNMGKIKGYLNK
jgi:GT2 family glycosyltransferase